MLNNGNLTKTSLLIISAPAGTGKSTLVNMLKKELPSIAQSISYTTREKRKGEQDGKDYYFLSKEEFEAKIKEGDFLEYTSHYGHYYGTSKSHIEKLISEGKNVVLVIDTEGAKAIKALKVPAIFVFITPPSLDELKRRLKDRATEKDQDLQKRLEKVDEELEAVQYYDYHIENNNLQEAYNVLKSIVIAEEHRIIKN